MGIGGAFSAGDLFPFFKYLGLHKKFEKRCMNIFVKLDQFFQELVDQQKKIMNDGIKKGEKNLIQVLLELQKTDPDYSTEYIIKGLIQVGSHFKFPFIFTLLIKVLYKFRSHNFILNQSNSRI